MSSVGKPPLPMAEQAAKACALIRVHIELIGLCEQLKKLNVITVEEFDEIKAAHEKEIRKAINLHQPVLKLVE